MKKTKEILIKLNNWKFVILIIIIIGGCFYWFSVRPAIIYSNCNIKAKEILYEKDNLTIISAQSLYDISFKMCIRSKGVNR